MLMAADTNQSMRKEYAYIYLLQKSKILIVLEQIPLTCYTFYF